jgi:hypothetical protein
MKWKEHTSTDKFATDFAAIIQNQELDTDQRAARVEEFFIEEAQKAGVVRVSRSHKYKNPNRLEKQLAPWFSSECYTARYNYKRIKK